MTGSARTRIIEVRMLNDRGTDDPVGLLYVFISIIKRREALFRHFSFLISHSSLIAHFARMIYYNRKDGKK